MARPVISSNPPSFPLCVLAVGCTRNPPESNFKEAHGHTNVPQDHGPLGFWVRTQAIQYRKFKNGRAVAMTDERVEKLRNIGFTFNATYEYESDHFLAGSVVKAERYETSWNQKYEELV